MTYNILYKRNSFNKEEIEVASKYFNTYKLRTEIPEGSTVICRYAALPDNRELELDLLNLGSKLINSNTQHNWIANFDYYDEIKQFTPRSWREYEFPSCNHKGPFVVKGATNSLKNSFYKNMYAANRIEASRVASNIAKDCYVGQQSIIYREFIELRTFAEDPINRMPIANEHRLFFYKNTLLSHGYYWDNSEFDPPLDAKGLQLAQKVADIVQHYVNFYVIDIAETKDGEWIVIELNDGQQSGLSRNDPNTLYSNLKSRIERNA